jgi:hypothetical protein
MADFSQHFGINLPQAQLDFVNVDTDHDLPLFLDPYGIEIKRDIWSLGCADAIQSYFQELLDALRAGKDSRAQHLIAHLHEPRETYLGLSKGQPQGRGLGHVQGNRILEALKNSSAIRSGALCDLSEAELFIDGIGPDMISDLTTNVLRGKLIEYTREQCNLYNINNLQQYAGPPIWNEQTKQWESKYCELPFVNGEPVILVPKYSVRRRISLNSQEFYNFHMIEFLRAEHLKANSSLVHILKVSKQPHVFKKDVKERSPYSKEALAEFVVRYPEVLEYYKKVKGAEGSLENSDFEKGFDEKEFAQILSGELSKIAPGREQADRYHNFILSVLNFLFYPRLITPIKEAPINDGRKRIDIRFTNTGNGHFFRRILNSPQTRALSTVFECKNYTSDIKNPEVDQIAMRFSPVRGFFGAIVCRTVADYQLLGV